MNDDDKCIDHLRYTEIGNINFGGRRKTTIITTTTTTSLNRSQVQY